MNSHERLILALIAAMERSGDEPEDIELCLALAHTMSDAELAAWVDDLNEAEEGGNR